MRGYTKIDAWKLADDLTVEIYSMTKRFPREEIYGITSQIRRAASSAAANIVVGPEKPLRWEGDVKKPGISGEFLQG